MPLLARLSKSANGDREDEEQIALIGDKPKSKIESIDNFPGRRDDTDYGLNFEADQNKSSKYGEKSAKSSKSIQPKSSFRDLYQYASFLDLCLLVIGGLASIITGAGFPFLSVIFGGMSNSFIAAQVSLTNSTRNSNFTNVTSSSSSPPQISLEQFHNDTVTYSLQYAYLGLAIMVCAYVQFSCWSLCSERQIHKIRKEFFKAILRQEISWFDLHQSGELTNKFSDDLERIKEGTGDKVGLLLQYVFQIVSGFVVAFFYSWKLSLVMLAIVPLMALSSFFMAKMIVESTRKEQKIYSVAGAIAEEVLSCIRTVIAFNGQAQETARYEKALARGKKTGIMKSVYTAYGFGSIFFFMFCTYALAIWYGAILIVNGEIERGTVFVVLFSVMVGSMGLGNAAPLIGVVAVAKGASASVLDIVKKKPTIDPYSRMGKRLPKPKGELKFENVHFSYPSRTTVPVLRGISFQVEPGQSVALVGPSGCGKSTIISLLLRFYEHHSGKIMIDGRPIEQLNVRWMRNLIGVVSQEPILFNFSIEENIRFGRIDAEFDEIVQAAKMANAHDFIMQLPEGYKTIAGERGAQMSGGQKQRIAIARALVRDPKILLLDEATSALDSESESVVQQALDLAQKGRTTIVVAHRLSTIRNVSKILVINEGTIKEIGQHEELMNLKGLYHDLVTAQNINTSEYAENENSMPKENIEDTQIRRRKSTLKSSTSCESITAAGSNKNLRSRQTSLIGKNPETELDRIKAELKDYNVQSSTFFEIIKANSPEWVYILLGLLGASIRGVVMPAFAFFYAEVFNTYSKTGDELTHEATTWAIIFLLLGLVMALSSIFSSYCFGVSGEALTMRLRLGVFKNLLRQSVDFFDNPINSTGRICTRLSTDAPNIKAAVDFRLSTVLASFISMLAGIVIAFMYGWRLAILLMLLLPFIGFGGYLNMKIRHSSQLSDSKLLEKAGKIASEGVENIRTVQALTREKTFYDTFCDELATPHGRAMRQTQLHSVSYAFAQCVIFFAYAACFRYGGYLVEQGLMTPTAVFKVFFAITFCGMSISWATAYFPDYIKARFSAALIFTMMKLKPKIDNLDEQGMKITLIGNVTMSDVKFSYPMRPEVQVLRGIDFKVTQGQTLALVGASGCGKSTIVSLIERFYDPSSGHIILDGDDLKALNLQHIRNQMAIVNQEPVLFNCSIAENISYGLADLPYSRVVDSAKEANIHSFIISLPEGYETMVGEKGTMLSGGQKQRIAIARALVRNPKVLLLDEATSALDTENEKLVQEALERARSGRTCIVIAHRLSTVQNADSIAVMKSGKIVEQGSHNELLEKRGIYFQLTKRQDLLSS